jgi:hypothetical protein
VKHIKPLPHNDQETVENICKKRAGWFAHKDIWIQAGVTYKLAGGNPWLVKPAVFTADISSDLENLYESRRKGGYIKKIRDHYGAGSCPLCGSLGVGTVDHFLPKAVYPEFAIYSLNLIPACPYCNSDEKGSTYQGESAPARLIHPYFDKLGEQAIVSVAFKEPYEAADICAIPGPGLSGDDFEIVSFHINKLLGDEFKRFVRNLWSTLPQAVIDLISGPQIEAPPATTRAQIQLLLTLNQHTYGLNSWPAAFYRGVLADPAVINFVSQKATAILSSRGN